MIGAHVVIPPTNHVFADRDVPIRNQGLTREGVVIGTDGSPHMQSYSTESPLATARSSAPVRL
jgi:hypothetical protein